MSTDSPPAEDPRSDFAALLGALRTRALRIVIVTALLLVVTFVVLMLMPRIYEATARLLVEDRSGGTASMDAVIARQIELIGSRDTLLAVIDSQNLRSSPEFNGTSHGPLDALIGLVVRPPASADIDQTVLDNLMARLVVNREGTSGVISITVSAGDARIAADIANAIATKHAESWAGQALTDPALAGLEREQQVTELQTRLQEAEQAVVAFDAAGGGASVAANPQAAEARRQVGEAEARRSSAQQRANAIRDLIEAGQPLEAIEDVRISPVVQLLMQNRAALQAQLAEKRATLLPAHPTVRSLNSQIAQLDVQISNEARRIADSLAAQVTVEDDIIASLNSDLARLDAAAPAAAGNNADREALVRAAEARRAELNALLAETGTSDLALAPVDVRLITEAVPPAIPSSPKGMLVLGVVGALALLLQIGGVVLGARRSDRAATEPRDVWADNEEPALEPVAEAEPESAFAGSVAEMVALMEADMADQPEPEPEPVIVPPAAPAPQHDDGLELLAADLTLGRARIVFLAGISTGRDAAVVADTLVSDALANGMSVCRIDAGSGRPSAVPGLTDLCADAASFGDVVHRVRDGLAEVPWGETPALDRRSIKPVTLVEALADIYEVVIVSTGGIGLNTSLPIFAGVPGRLVLVRQAATPSAIADAAMADAASIGFASVESVLVPEPQSAVA